MNRPIAFCDEKVRTSCNCENPYDFLVPEWAYNSPTEFERMTGINFDKETLTEVKKSIAYIMSL